MPTQWRTIAPIIGRTPMQCLEHYEKLLDQAQGEGEGGAPGDDPRRLRPGEIDPHTQARPARPDPIDMDEDAKEMLSEARARLANTQGKKAKRKARERQLEEAKRLARLQKRRELRAAGIDTNRGTRRKRGVDYNAEIPFEKQAPKGFHDPGEDDAYVAPERKRGFRTDIEGEGKTAREEKKRKEDDKKLEELKKKDLPAALMKINKLRGAPQSKRSKLMLPSPQVSDQELEDLAKLGQTGAEALAGAGEDAAPTRALLQDYNETPSVRQPMRTPRAPASQDSILLEAQNIIALNQTTPVLSVSKGENEGVWES